MKNWNSQTDALRNSKAGLKVVDGLLGFVTTTVGKPSTGEKALFAGAVVFAYGVWENYVEQLAIEIVKELAPKINPAKISKDIRDTLAKKSTWELAIEPGWRLIWVGDVEKMALGDGNSFGLNTAKCAQVKNLLKFSGIAEPLKSLTSQIIPAHIAKDVLKPEDAIDALVILRGEIVHTGKAPNTLRKQHVKEWREFVEALMVDVDKCCRDQCKDLLIVAP